MHLKLKFHYLLVELKPATLAGKSHSPRTILGRLATQLVFAAAPSCRAARSCRAPHLHPVRTAPSREQMLARHARAVDRSSGSPMQPRHTQLDSCMPMTFCRRERLSRRSWHARPRAYAQHVVRSNPLLTAHLGDVAGRKRVGLVCSSESAAQGS